MNDEHKPKNGVYPISSYKSTEKNDLQPKCI